jgi:fungalysin metallopeptidase (M36)/thrombospondin type 3 repeat protein/peptidase YpeB-like protein/fungalysin/thermolysin propeptide
VESERAFGVTFRRYRQVVDGLPVLGGEAVVTDAPGRSRELLVDSTRRRVGSPTHAGIARDDAVARARAATGGRPLRADPRATLAILAQHAGSRAVWQVLLAAREPVSSWEVLVDARSGEVVRTRDLLERETGRASLFLPNPVTANGGRGTLADNNDMDPTGQLAALRTPVTLERLESASTCLRGQWAWALVWVAPLDQDVCRPNRDFSSLTRSMNGFEPVMAYFHIDRTQAYIQSLRFGNVLNRQVRAIANAFPDDNSAFDPLTGEILLGSGGADDGEDGDVIVHEYGHAVQHDQVAGFGQSVQGGAMGEGFGDYLAAALDAQRAPSATFNPCIGEWDQLGTGDPATLPCVRRTDLDLTAADVGPGSSCNAEIHCAGQAWSGALWAIRARLGGETADRLVIQSHFSLTPSAGFQDGSRALLFADRTLYGGANQQFLREVLAARGLADVERLDDTPAEAVPLPVPGSATGRLGGSDLHDMYGIELVAGRGVVVTLEGGPADLDVRLLAPGAFAPGDRVVGGSTGPTASESFAYAATESGSHFLDVSTPGDAGEYVLTVLSDRDADARADETDNCPDVANAGQEDRDADRLGDVCDRFPADAANDVDGDGIGADRDNCRTKRNPTQADWDHDRRGDACDPSARAGILRVRTRGRRVSVRAVLRPTLLPPSALRVRVLRRVCVRGRCRERLLREVRGRRGSRAGQPTAVLRLAPGRYVLTAVVRATGYSRAASRRVRVKVRA